MVTNLAKFWFLAYCSLWRQSKHEAPGSTTLVNDEETSLNWDGIFGPTTWTLLVPTWKHKINIVIFSLIAGAISFLSSVIFRYEVISSFFYSQGLSITVTTSCWITVYITLQGWPQRSFLGLCKVICQSGGVGSCNLSFSLFFNCFFDFLIVKTESVVMRFSSLYSHVLHLRSPHGDTRTLKMLRPEMKKAFSWIGKVDQIDTIPHL